MTRRTRPQKRLPRPLVEVVRADLPTARPHGARVIGVGFDAIAWRLPDPTGDWVLRVPRHPDALATLAAQTALMRSLAGRVPVPRDARLVGGDHEYQCGAYRYVEGRPAHPRDEAESDRLASVLGSILSRLHVHSVDDLANARRVHPVLDRFGPAVKRCLPYLHEAHHARIPTPVLVHADLKPDHVLLDHEGGVAALLDFEGIQVTDQAVDFSRLIQHWGRPFAERALTDYTLPADESLIERAQIYRDLDALELLDTALKDKAPEWTELALRMLDNLVAH